MVQHEYWGLLGWNHKIILLTNYIQKDDFFNREDLFFIEGRRCSGGLVQYLPMYEVYCTRTNRLKDAEIDLRLLHDGPPRDGVRLLGNTYQFFPRTQTWTVAPGRKVLIDGPSVQTVATSDEHGIYDISGLVPGTYYVQPFDAGADGHRHISCEFKSLQTGTVRACDVVVP